MITKILYLFIIIGLFSCNRTDNTIQNSKPEMILNLKNVTESNIKLLLVKNEDSLSIILPQDSTMELVGLRDSSYGFTQTVFEQIIKEKLDYLSYQKFDSITVVLIDKKNDIYLTDLDILPNSKGPITVNVKDNKSKIERAILNYPLE